MQLYWGQLLDSVVTITSQPPSKRDQTLWLQRCQMVAHLSTSVCTTMNTMAVTKAKLAVAKRESELGLAPASALQAHETELQALETKLRALMDDFAKAEGTEQEE